MSLEAGVKPLALNRPPLDNLITLMDQMFPLARLPHPLLLIIFLVQPQKQPGAAAHDVPLAHPKPEVVDPFYFYVCQEGLFFEDFYFCYVELEAVAFLFEEVVFFVRGFFEGLEELVALVKVFELGHYRGVHNVVFSLKSVILMATAFLASKTCTATQACNRRKNDNNAADIGNGLRPSLTVGSADRFLIALLSAG